MKKYSREFYEFVRDNIKGTRYWQMCELVKEKFGIEISAKTMGAYCKNHKLRNGLFHKHEGIRTKKLTTPEMDEYIKSINFMRTAKEVATMVNEKFGTNFTYEQIKRYRGRNHLNSGLTGRFEKGHIPDNKGKKCLLKCTKNVKEQCSKKETARQIHIQQVLK